LKLGYSLIGSSGIFGADDERVQVGIMLAIHHSPQIVNIAGGWCVEAGTQS
jgi:hypothetical protein